MHGTQRVGEHAPGGRGVGVGHFTCESRHTGEATAKQLCAFFLHEREIDMDAVRVIGEDGTNQLVGWWGGCMAKLEELLGRLLNRVVYHRHQTEQPYRVLFH